MAQITEMHVIIKLFIYLFLSEPKSFLRKVFCTLQRSFFFFLQLGATTVLHCHSLTHHCQSMDMHLG